VVFATRSDIVAIAPTAGDLSARHIDTSSDVELAIAGAPIGRFVHDATGAGTVEVGSHLFEVTRSGYSNTHLVAHPVAGAGDVVAKELGGDQWRISYDQDTVLVRFPHQHQPDKVADVTHLSGSIGRVLRDADGFRSVAPTSLDPALHAMVVYAAHYVESRSVA
jgi:hypothetical protein